LRELKIKYERVIVLKKLLMYLYGKHEGIYWMSGLVILMIILILQLLGELIGILNPFSFTLFTFVWTVLVIVLPPIGIMSLGRKFIIRAEYGGKSVIVSTNSEGQIVKFNNYLWKERYLDYKELPKCVKENVVVELTANIDETHIAKIFVYMIINSRDVMKNQRYYNTLYNLWLTYGVDDTLDHYFYNLLNRRFIEKKEEILKLIADRSSKKETDQMKSVKIREEIIDKLMIPNYFDELISVEISIGEINLSHTLPKGT